MARSQTGDSIMELVAIVVFLGLAAIILGKAGYSGWWALLMLIPIVNLVMLWSFALRRWPALEQQE